MIWTVDTSSSLALREQIGLSVRRALASGDLAIGDQLPPAAELADAIGVDRNTVLAAYRELRDDGVLEFRRGRGVRVVGAKRPPTNVLRAAERLLATGRETGVDRDDLIRILRELP